MRQMISKISFIALVLALFGIVLYLLFELFHRSLDWVMTLNPSIDVAIIAACGTAVMSVLTLVLAKLAESSMLLKKDLREKKTPVYEDLIKFTLKVVTASKLETPLTDQQLIAEMTEINQRFMVWGSDEVLSAWIKWRRLAVDSEAIKTNPMALMFCYEEFVYAIRRDLGHTNLGLNKGDVLSIFVNDIDRHLSKSS